MPDGSLRKFQDLMTHEEEIKVRMNQDKISLKISTPGVEKIEVGENNQCPELDTGCTLYKWEY